MVAQNNLKWYSKHKNLSGFEAEIINSFANEKSITELAKLYNVSTHAIKSIIIKNDYKLRSPKESRNLASYNTKRNNTVCYKFTEDQINEIKSLYSGGYGVYFLAKKYDVDSSVVMRVLTENNIPVRNWAEQQQYKHITTDIFKKTIIQKYGGWSHLHELHKKSLRKKYGVENVMQIPTVFYKQQQSGKKIKTMVIDGKQINYQGYEDRGVKFLLGLGYCIDDIQIGKGNVPVIRFIFNGKLKTYYPDIFIPKDNLIVEVKSTYTMQKEYDLNIAKKEATEQQGYKVDFLIF